MDMIKKIIVLQIFIALLLSGCSFKNKNVQVDLGTRGLGRYDFGNSNKIKKLQSKTLLNLVN